MCTLRMLKDTLQSVQQLRISQCFTFYVDIRQNPKDISICYSCRSIYQEIEVIDLKCRKCLKIAIGGEIAKFRFLLIRVYSVASIQLRLYTKREKERQRGREVVEWM